MKSEDLIKMEKEYEASRKNGKRVAVRLEDTQIEVFRREHATNLKEPPEFIAMFFPYYNAIYFSGETFGIAFQKAVAWRENKLAEAKINCEKRASAERKRQDTVRRKKGLPGSTN